MSRCHLGPSKILDVVPKRKDCACVIKNEVYKTGKFDHFLKYIRGIFASTLALAVEWCIFAKDELWKIN